MGLQRLKSPSGSEGIRDDNSCQNKDGSFGAALAPRERQEKPCPPVAVGR